MRRGPHVLGQRRKMHAECIIDHLHTQTRQPGVACYSPVLPARSHLETSLTESCSICTNFLHAVGVRLRAVRYFTRRIDGFTDTAPGTADDAYGRRTGTGFVPKH